MKDLMLRMIVFCLFSGVTMAAESTSHNHELGAGRVAETLLEPIGVLSDLISTVCFVIGGAFLFASLIKYIEHRRSPLMVPISTVVYLLIIGLILVLLPFISLLTDSGMVYSLFKSV